MRLSPFIFSKDNYFSIGINSLLTPELIDKYYDILDLETTSYKQIKRLLRPRKKIVVFISNDIDYYSLRHVNNVMFIDKRSKPSAIFSYLAADDSSFAYQVRKKLSKRENEVLSHIQRGLSACEIGTRLGINVKTIYSHRRNLIGKLHIENKIHLYRNIARIDHKIGKAF
ncbi:LuxR C-terminal-related transcriptional regulator (plasmid) [Hafnia alvei]|uniref:helix-turn-helix transcriptional regulator n=1 Tax=Hafnia alvei TaxID=569 RepID=UPI0028BF59EA|nr:LuxR C-terminal-related transcriptional regulator [Hafnia alvei]WNN54674.1 LuxR C-terminal-related transcriptional regulator [Hafnia alvei]